MDREIVRNQIGTYQQLLEEQLAELREELVEVKGERDLLLKAVKSAYGHAVRKVLCKCRDVLGQAMADAAAFTEPATNTEREG